jgi:hypothetical protein
LIDCLFVSILVQSFYIISGEVKLQASHRKGARISEQAPGSIFYEPDSGDDWDEEDPDEDLNI